MFPSRAWAVRWSLPRRNTASGKSSVPRTVTPSPRPQHRFWDTGSKPNIYDEKLGAALSIWEHCINVANDGEHCTNVAYDVRRRSRCLWLRMNFLCHVRLICGKFYVVRVRLCTTVTDLTRSLHLATSLHPLTDRKNTSAFPVGEKPIQIVGIPFPITALYKGKPESRAEQALPHKIATHCGLN